VGTVGETVARDAVFGTVEAVKTTSDLFIPVTARVLEVNQKVEDDPSLINSDPYGDGWIVKIQILDAGELASLMDSAAYQNLVH
jgi:glycine cleavage system H protein